MSGSLLIKNRQHAKTVNTRLLKTLTKTLLEELLGLGDFDLVIYIVGATEMAQLNEKFLQHSGSTDVITFDYSDTEQLHGEIFICANDAVAQARQFAQHGRASWLVMSFTACCICGDLTIFGPWIAAK